MPLAHVAVAAGLGDVGLAGEYARPRNQPRLNGRLETVIAAARVPDGGEPGHQRFPQDAGHGVGVDRAGVVVLKVGAERVIDSADVGVRVDQAGHDGVAPGVDHPRVPRRGYLLGRAYCGYAAALDHDRARAVGLAPRGIEYGGILQNYCFGHINLIYRYWMGSGYFAPRQFKFAAILPLDGRVQWKAKQVRYSQRVLVLDAICPLGPAA